MFGERVGGQRGPRRLDHRADGDDVGCQLGMTDLVEHAGHPAARDAQLLGIDDQWDHDLDMGTHTPIEESCRSSAQCPDLHFVQPGPQDAEAHAPCADHRVRLVEPADCCQLDAAGFVEFAAGLACNEIEEVGQELVQRWVEEPDRDGEAVHGLEDRLEVGDLGFLQLVERGSLGRSIAAEDEPAHDRQPVGGEEHVLGAAESDALRSEFAGERRIVGGVGVGPDLDVPSGHIVGPGEQRVEFRRRHRSERVQCPEIDAAGAAIDGDRHRPLRARCCRW